MFADHEYVPISALEHYSYCPRQCALIHVEQVFDVNVFTVREINPEQDSLRIYRLRQPREESVTVHGIDMFLDMDQPLIV